MDSWELNEHRRSRLIELLTARFEGNKAAMGKALGYSSGAFVRQMLEGERPITEKTVAKVHELPGCKGWFDRRGEAAVVPVAAGTSGQSIEHGIGILAAALDSLSDADRERAATMLATLARAPDSQRARAALAAALGHAAAAPLGASGRSDPTVSEYALDLARQLDAIPAGPARGRAHAAASLALSLQQAQLQAGSATERQVPPPSPRPDNRSGKRH